MNEACAAQLKYSAAQYGIELGAAQLEQFAVYQQFLLEYNENVNLTAITDPEEVWQKHFLDSLLLLHACPLPQGASLVDVGTGAGFPGVPVKIARPDISLTLLDSLNKRLVFLRELGGRLNLSYECCHSRAEDAGSSPALREAYDCSTARAVADLAVLCEYCLPLTKVGGSFIALKGQDCAHEVESATRAIELLGGALVGIKKYELPNGDGRSAVIIKKVAPTPLKYPRSPAVMAKKPL